MNARVASSMNPYLQWIKEKSNSPTEHQFQSELAEYQASYYAGGTSRFLPMPTGVQAMGSDADSHYRQEQAYFLAVERGRFEDRENMVLGQGINRLTSNVLQNGFVHDSQAPDEDLADDLNTGWLDYANDPKQVDHEGERNLDKIADLGFRNMIVDGDISHLILENGSLQTMEAHYMRSPWSTLRAGRQETNGIIHGVELKNGHRVAYHYTPESLNSLSASRYQTRRIETFNEGGIRQVLHVYNPRRFTQRRGVTTIAPIVFPAKYHDDLQFAALVNAKRQSFIATIHEFDLASEDDGSNDISQNRSQPYIPGVTSREYETGSPGTKVKGLPGEKIKPWTTNVPSHSHFQHADLLMTIMSINLDLPMIVFFLDASKGNFNTFRCRAPDPPPSRGMTFQRVDPMSRSGPSDL